MKKKCKSCVLISNIHIFFEPLKINIFLRNLIFKGEEEISRKNDVKSKMHFKLERRTPSLKIIFCINENILVNKTEFKGHGIGANGEKNVCLLHYFPFFLKCF